MSIEKEIKQQRVRLGWTQEKLGSIVGVRQATISRIENSAKNSSWGLLQKILIALNVNINENINLVHDYALKESDVDSFLKLLLAKPELRTYILYNPINSARVIISAFQKGYLNFQKKNNER